jgi:predicted RND superfamily exporter protein
VDRVGSLIDVLGAAQRALAPEQGALPGSRAAVAQYLLLLEMAPAARLETMIDEERRVLRVHARLRDEGFLATHRVGGAALERARQRLGEGARASASGLTYLLGEWLDVIVEGQRNAVGAALFTILVMMVLALRSLRAGLWSMIPNALPLLALIGYVGLAWERVDSDAYIVCLVAIGVGVDDTIHFLVRYRRERRRALEIDAAIEASFAYAGRAIVITSVILVAGFAPLASSGYFTTRIFGTLLPGCLVVALLAVLLLVPALAKLGAFEGMNRSPPSR